MVMVVLSVYQWFGVHLQAAKRTVRCNALLGSCVFKRIIV